MTIAAISSEFSSAACAAGSCHAFSYHLVVKPSKGSAMIVESLNENSASSSTGPNRNASTARQ